MCVLVVELTPLVSVIVMMACSLVKLVQVNFLSVVSGPVFKHSNRPYDYMLLLEHTPALGLRRIV